MNSVTFVNVFIRRAELEGKIGTIELEANENLPITWNQQKDAIMELFQLNNEGINADFSDSGKYSIFEEGYWTD